MASSGLPKLRLLRLQGVPIFEQLKLEEALFRVDPHNWFIWNERTKSTNIVMGISGKPERLLDVDAVARDKIPVIKRFSGGGTVVVDNSTVFTTFVINTSALPQVKPYPREIMEWSSTFYTPLFQSLLGGPRSTSHPPTFALREDDYVFGDRKFAGNAQSIGKDRWLHHTSFLWDYSPRNMQYLQNPAKQPKYRAHRDHTDFLCKLKDVVSSQDDLFHAFHRELHSHFDVDDVMLTPDEVHALTSSEHRKSTRWVEVTAPSSPPASA
ncbi:hypothetical protein H310_11542 [Aphanomyces invadans]|uniref:BPL/LPL catalytic domain-containing protein n=1 Tax=Aphanomyces invadans TaxID=157072 RepID=A0A024TNK3_9STRA|nr:hypothetical protein H310_11542 [Aphanomyces invadans]ETV94887.1 hypothetical protein H310_11542 [Aphanomyces invadans]|eukprot:XP_008876478.1 hypothetical protein H310_11542 [Aphanomyces invadans]